jgi:nucleoside-diphosphate-sugar epimerase
MRIEARAIMNVVITGGAGFLGRRLAERLLQRGHLRGPDGSTQSIDRITLVDVVSTNKPADPRLHQITGDIADAVFLEGAIDAGTTSIFHLAAVVSGMAEADFDAGMRVNIDASRMLLDLCRARGHRPRFVFASSVAVYGAGLPETVSDHTVVLPQSSYGTQKAIVELLINDYSRRGFVDGRVLRLPTISVRPGRPNAAASSFASGIVREPLNGEDAICPVGAGTRLWLLSPAAAIECLIAMHDAQSADLGPTRIVNAPGVSVTVGEMVASLARVAGPHITDRIRWERDPRVERIVASWPGAWDASRAVALGLRGDDSFDGIVRSYMNEAGL